MMEMLHRVTQGMVHFCTAKSPNKSTINIYFQEVVGADILQQDILVVFLFKNSGNLSSLYPAWFL